MRYRHDLKYLRLCCTQCLSAAISSHRSLERGMTYPVIRKRVAWSLNRPSYRTLTSGKQKYIPVAPCSSLISVGLATNVPYIIETCWPISGGSGAMTTVASSPLGVRSVRWHTRYGSSSYLFYQLLPQNGKRGTDGISISPSLSQQSSCIMRVGLSAIRDR